MIPPAPLDPVRYSALDSDPVIVVDAGSWVVPDHRVQAVIIGTDWRGILPECNSGAFDLLLTTASDPRAPWVQATAERCRGIEARIRRWPVAATMLCQMLRMTEALPFDAGLVAESLAYSTLLGGAEFKHWLAEQDAEPSEQTGDLVRFERDADHVTLTLCNPGANNAMTAAMRDALHEALCAVLDDPTAPTVSLRAEGKCFSTGGDIAEFGSATDLAQAHVIRTLRSCAALIDSLGDRIDVHFDGAAIGSGLEVPTAAPRRTASPKAWFQLPELQMGLIPGAGGTVTVSRAIGRHRTAWMVLSGKRVSAERALDWGLVQALIA